jgi:hypothetical protein
MADSMYIDVEQADTYMFLPLGLPVLLGLSFFSNIARVPAFHK